VSVPKGRIGLRLAFMLVFGPLPLESCFESRFCPLSRLNIHEQSNCEQSQKHRHVLFSITSFCSKYLSLPAITAKLKMRSSGTPFSLARSSAVTSHIWALVFPPSSARTDHPLSPYFPGSCLLTAGVDRMLLGSLAYPSLFIPISSPLCGLGCYWIHANITQFLIFLPFSSCIGVVYFRAWYYLSHLESLLELILPTQFLYLSLVQLDNVADYYPAVTQTLSLPSHGITGSI
jgi:hypothetical protein